jgi:hypothetical protein
MTNSKWYLGTMRILLASLLAFACGAETTEHAWQPIATVHLTDAGPSTCWRIDGGAALATSELDAEQPTPGPHTWPSGAEIVVWSSDGSKDVDALNHDLTDCP